MDFSTHSMDLQSYAINTIINFRTLFITSPKKPQIFNCHSSFPALPAPGNHSSTLCLSRIAYPRYFL